MYFIYVATFASIQNPSDVPTDGFSSTHGLPADGFSPNPYRGAYIPHSARGVDAELAGRVGEGVDCRTGPALRGVELCSRPGPPKTKGPSPLIETGRLQVCSIGSSCSLD